MAVAANQSSRQLGAARCCSLILRPFPKQTAHVSLSMCRACLPACSQIASILTHIAADQHLTVAPGLAQTIAEESSRNLRRAILMMEAAKVKLSVGHHLTAMLSTRARVSRELRREMSLT